MSSTALPSWIFPSRVPQRPCRETRERRAILVEHRLAHQRREREAEKAMRMIVPMR
jgi:hypothetical protein